MHHLTQKVVGKVCGVASEVIPEHRREKFDRRLEEMHRKGYLSTTAYEELQAATTPRAEPDPFPDLESIATEPAVKRWYNWEEKKWETGRLDVKIHPEKFAEGGMRAAHFMVIVHPDGRQERCVAKRQKDGDHSSDVYESDVVMQSCCQAIADAFNARNPAKKVEFVDCFMIQRKDKSWWGVEAYLKGKYIKYNSNFGYIGKDARNTPQAFSHFSYDYSGEKLMIVDIQGVDDKYTDPQIHTTDGSGFGLGNLGQLGISRFMKTHWCNPVCTYLGLPFCAPKKFGFQLHQHPKQVGTVVKGAAAAQGAPSMCIADYISDLQPMKGSATPEDLALLGLSERHFNALAEEFNKLDKDKSGYLDKEELFGLFQKARITNSKTQEADEFVKFVQRVEGQLNSQGKVSFKAFILCWTDCL